MKIIATLGVGGYLLFLAAILAGVAGWFMNIAHFIHQLPVFDTLEIVRLVGIIIPIVGAVLGWFA